MNTLPQNILVHLAMADVGKKTQAFARELQLGLPEKPLKIGVWDLGAWLGNLPVLLDRLNAAQSSYDFFTIEATVPSGMIRKGEGVVEWLRQAGEKISVAEKRLVLKSIGSMVSDDYYPLAKKVRTDLKLDYLVGITPTYIADNESKPGWDYFSTSKGRLVLASSADLRRFSKESNIPFDRFLGTLIVGQLLVAQFSGRLGFHDPNTLCLFDYNNDRETVKASVRELRIEPACMAKIGPRFRKPAAALISALLQIK